jgi:hypothetical protein
MEGYGYEGNVQQLVSPGRERNILDIAFRVKKPDVLIFVRYHFENEEHKEAAWGEIKNHLSLGERKVTLTLDTKITDSKGVYNGVGFIPSLKK